jgi:hypothetical protein
MANKTVTVSPSGGTYTNLASAIAGELSVNPNIVTMNGILTILITGVWSVSDSSPVYITGFTTDSTNYIQIITDSNNRAGSSFSNSKYKLSLSGAANITILQNYTRIIGLQIENTDLVNRSAVIINYLSLYNVLDSCLISDLSTIVPCVAFSIDNTQFAYMINCIVIGGSTGAYTSGNGGHVYFYNCDFIGAYSYGVWINQYHWCIFINCFASGGVAGYFDNGGSASTFTNCASSDGSKGTTTVAYNTSTFTNITPGSQDLSLPTGSSLIGVGTNLSGDSIYPFNWDIANSTRTTWDIGSVKYSGGGFIPSPIVFMLSSFRNK